MDEYLFITMAKLKADRLRLEREQARTAGPKDREPHERADSQRSRWSFAESTEQHRWSPLPR